MNQDKKIIPLESNICLCAVLVIREYLIMLEATLEQAERAHNERPTCVVSLEQVGELKDSILHAKSSLDAIGKKMIESNVDSITVDILSRILERKA